MKGTKNANEEVVNGLHNGQMDRNGLLNPGVEIRIYQGGGSITWQFYSVVHIPGIKDHRIVL